MRWRSVLVAVCALCVVPGYRGVGAPPETISIGLYHLEWTGTVRESGAGKFVPVRLKTSRGEIRAEYYPAANSDASARMGVVWVEGAGNHGSDDGPPVTIYPTVCERLQKMGIASLHLHYRRPNYLVHCVLDTLCGIAFLSGEGIDRIGLVGHSFGGAVVISAGAVSSKVWAVVPMSSQTDGTDFAAHVSPRPMLLIHGTSDSVLPSSCSEEIYAEARQPKELRLFKGAGHNLEEARGEVMDLLVKWIPEKLAREHQW